MRRCATRSVVRLVLAALLGSGLAGCGGRVPASMAIPNELPEVQLTAAPQAGSTTSFVVHLSWSAFDPDGQVVRFVYALDPPVVGDTAWATTVDHQLTLSVPAQTPPNPLTPVGQLVWSTDAHTFVIRAVDNQGGESPVITRSFTARTVAPSTTITNPSPNREIPVGTLSQLTITWKGDDPDGATRRTPVVYKWRIVPERVITPETPNSMPTNAAVQAFFGPDFATGFATWDSTTDTPSAIQLTGLTASTVYVLAVVARDEAGAYEPRFLLDANVLAFRPSLSNLGPAITVSNQFFAQTQHGGGVSLAPDRIFDMECPPRVVLHCRWNAVPTQGTSLGGYRWALDLPDGDVSSTVPRKDDSDFQHWSNWALGETGADIGPFNGSVDTTVSHFLYVEARDQIGFISLFTLRMRVIVARFDQSLLVIDDMYGQLGAAVTGNPYPTEAEQDTFHFAAGGFPDQLVGGVSRPGAFADFDYDTLDYQFEGTRAGIPLALLGRYRAVAWYTDNFSSGASGENSFSTPRPPDAIRYANTVGRLNSLAAYLAQGGKVFLFGEGIVPSIGNGSFSTTSSSGVPGIPYQSTPSPAKQYVLKPGCFLYDAMHLRSELNTAGTANIAFTKIEQLQGAIPYLPEFAGAASATDRTHDPRIGPSAARAAARWEGLPRFTMAAYRGANADPLQRSVNQTWYVSKPLFVTEGQGAAAASVLDTLYLLQARDYSLDGAGATSDGKPNAVDYHGGDNGEIVWFGFPMYFFELDQARQAVHTVLANLGVPPRTPGASRHLGTARVSR